LTRASRTGRCGQVAVQRKVYGTSTEIDGRIGRRLQAGNWYLVQAWARWRGKIIAACARISRTWCSWSTPALGDVFPYSEAAGNLGPALVNPAVGRAGQWHRSAQFQNATDDSPGQQSRSTGSACAIASPACVCCWRRP
jgi:hypothetical protein